MPSHGMQNFFFFFFIFMTTLNRSARHLENPINLIVLYTSFCTPASRSERKFSKSLKPQIDLYHLLPFIFTSKADGSVTSEHLAIFLSLLPALQALLFFNFEKATLELGGS